MEQRRRDMHQDQRKEGERQIEMRVPEQRMQAIALRQDRRKPHAPEHHDRVSACRQHRPTDQRHADHQGI